MGQSNQDVRTIYEDAQHNIWVGYSGGIVVLNPLTMEIIRHYNTENSELQSNFIRSIAQDEKGRFWIGTFGDGLGIYTPDLQKIKTFTQRDGFCSNTINQIIQDKQKRMWIGTGEGLVCFLSTDELNYKTYQRKDGLINTNICAIAEDKKGNIWFSNNKGISCYVTSKDCFTTMVTLMMYRREVSQAVVLHKTRTDGFISVLSMEYVVSIPISP